MVVKKNLESDGYNVDMIVTDGEHEIICYQYFSDPIKEKIEGKKVCEVTSLLAKNIMLSENDKYLISKGNSYYEYHLQGEVIETDKPIIGIGKIIIKLDQPLPKDIMKGQYIEFEVSRLDCIIE